MSLAPAALIPVDAYKFIFIGTGQPHDLMALIELEKEFTQYLEALKQTVEDRFDEYSALVKETTLSLSQWDAETENSVVALHNARDEQVSSSEGLSPCGCKRHFFNNNNRALIYCSGICICQSTTVCISISHAGADLTMQLKVKALLKGKSPRRI